MPLRATVLPFSGNTVGLISSRLCPGVGVTSADTELGWWGYGDDGPPLGKGLQPSEPLRAISLFHSLID